MLLDYFSVKEKSYNEKMLYYTLPLLFPLGFPMGDKQADKSLPVVGQSLKELSHLPTNSPETHG